MKRTILIIVLLSLAMISSFPSEIHSSHYIPAQEGATQLSYTSRDRSDSTVIQNGSTAWGDHVLINATYLLDIESVSASRLSILPEEGGNFTAISDDHTVTYDTYMIGKNTTASIQFRVTFENGTRMTIGYEDVMLANYFAPQITEVSVSGSGIAKTISWIVTDLNNDDSHIFEVYIRHHENNRWWLWASNITSYSVVFDMTYYFEGNWSVRVEVVDNDTVFRPSSSSELVIWPALRGYSDPQLFEGGCGDFSTSIPGINVSLLQMEPTGYGYSYNLTEGETGHISWTKRISMFDAHPDFSDSTYYIYRNGTLLKNGTISFGSISVDIEGLQIGTYNYTLLVTHKGYSVSDTVMVHILQNDSVGSSASYFELAMILMIGIVLLGIGICVIRDSKKPIV